MNHEKEREQQLATQVAAALKGIARRPDIKNYIEHNPQVYGFLQRAAARYVTGEERSQALTVADQLRSDGYSVSLEYIGENTTSAEACQLAKQELAALVSDMGQRGIKGRVSFDLSHIGLLVDPALALGHLLELGELADSYAIELFISMEESAKTDSILQVHRQAVASYPLIGITLQAQLHRTWNDANEWLTQGTRVRLVKGAYEEADTVSLTRSAELDQRYMKLFELAVERGCHISMATHDEALIHAILQRDWNKAASVELELLYGIRPELGVQLRKKGYPVRIYLTYGQEWYLYLCHRLAEYPLNLFQAFVDIVEGQREAPVMQYKMMSLS